jgi:hypothetical protein
LVGLALGGEVVLGRTLREHLEQDDGILDRVILPDRATAADHHVWVEALSHGAHQQLQVAAERLAAGAAKARHQGRDDIGADLAWSPVRPP